MLDKNLSTKEIAPEQFMLGMLHKISRKNAR